MADNVVLYVHVVLDQHGSLWAWISIFLVVELNVPGFKRMPMCKFCPIIPQEDFKNLSSSEAHK